MTDATNIVSNNLVSDDISSLFVDGVAQAVLDRLEERVQLEAAISLIVARVQEIQREEDRLTGQEDDLPVDFAVSRTPAPDGKTLLPRSKVSIRGKVSTLAEEALNNQTDSLSGNIISKELPLDNQDASTNNLTTPQSAPTPESEPRPVKEPVSDTESSAPKPVVPVLPGQDEVATLPFSEMNQFNNTDQFERLVSVPHLYDRIGYDQRTLVFSRDGSIGYGQAGRERYWSLGEQDGQVYLNISSEDELTCSLQEDGLAWVGQWFHGEQMPIRVSPLPLPPRDHENYLELFLPASGHRSCFLETLRQLEAIFSQSIPSEAISPDRRVIVEIGSLCNPHRSSQEYDGWSTLCFGWYAAATGAEFHTVDISEAHQQACQSVLENYSTQVNYHLAEGANFLQTFSKPIDLLYVDAWGNNPAHQDTHYVESYRSLIDKPGLILIKGVGEERAAETGRRGLVRQALFDGYQIAFQSSKHLLLQKGDTDTLEQTTDGGIAQTLAFNLDAPTKGVGDQVQKLTDANAAPQALPSLCSVLKTDPAKRKPPLLRLSSQQMYTRSYPMRVVSDSCGDFKSLSDTNILIYWPHGFGDWVFLSYVLPFLNPTNRYWVTRFGDDSPSVFDGSAFATPLYMGTNSPHCNDGGSFDNQHFGLRHEAVDGEEQLLSLPLALADQCDRLGIDTFFWSGHPEIHGRVASPFHTKARYLLPTLADPAILAQASLDRPLPSAINFHVPSWLTQWVEGRLQSFTGYGPRKLCLISRNGYTATGKNWGHMFREDLPEGKRREGEECRDFMRLLLKKDPHWLFLVTEDILFDGDSTVRSGDLHAYSYAQVFGSVGAATPPFGLIMKTLLNLSDLVVGVPAGPYHLSMAKPDLPTVGLWVEHLPSWYDEPKEASRHLISRNVADRGFGDRPGSFDASGGLNFSSRWLDTRIIPGEQVFEAVEELLYPESWQLRQSSSSMLESKEVSPLPDTELLLETELSPDFESLEAELKDTSILGEAKLRVMHRYLRDVRTLPGEAAELGVYRGGTARLIARMLPGRSVHLFDTFDGLPAPGENDLHAEGDFSDTSLEAVQSVLANLKNVHLHKGLFPATLPPSLLDQRFCFVHCDGDLYQSTQDFLEFFYPRMVLGGIMIFDDYEWAHCPGVKIALDDFLADKPEEVQVDQQYQAIVIKLGCD